MPIFDIFSKRQKRLRGEFPDVYQYDNIPDKLRVQITYIWDDVYGPYRSYGGNLKAYQHISQVLRREYGEFFLGQPANTFFQSVRNFFMRTKDTEEALDVIEVSFSYIDEEARYDSDLFPLQKITVDEAIDELNQRFREHGVGYQFASGKMIRVDSEFIHSEAVKPALSMLSDPMYEGANGEFLSAHEHY